MQCAYSRRLCEHQCMQLGILQAHRGLCNMLLVRNPGPLLHRLDLLQLCAAKGDPAHWPLCKVQKHGQKTAYAFMVDADFAVNGTWRLRLAAQRMQLECQYRCTCSRLPG